MVMQTSHASSLVQIVALSWRLFLTFSPLNIPEACLEWQESHTSGCAQFDLKLARCLIVSHRWLLFVDWHDQSLGSCARPLHATWKHSSADKSRPILCTVRPERGWGDFFAQTQQQLNPVQPWISAAVEISRLVKTAQMPSSEEVQHLAVHFAGNVDEGIPQQSRCNELITLKTLAVRGTIVREHGFICGLRWVGWQWW